MSFLEHEITFLQLDFIQLEIASPIPLDPPNIIAFLKAMLFFIYNFFNTLLIKFKLIACFSSG